MRDQKSQPIIATATVTNTGKRRATEIVQCYVNIRGASTEQPVRNLKGFARVTLDPGQTQGVRFPLGFDELSFYNAKAQQVVEPADYTVYIGAVPPPLMLPTSRLRRSSRQGLPKPGEQEMRPLGAPTVAGRALQRSATQVLSAIL